MPEGPSLVKKYTELKIAEVLFVLNVNIYIINSALKGC